MDQDALDASPVFQVEPEPQAEWSEEEAYDDESLVEDEDEAAMDLADADALLAEVESEVEPPVRRRRTAVAPPPKRSGVDPRSVAGWIWTVLGATAAAAGATGIWLTLSNSTALETATSAMERMGLAPIHLLALGALFLGLGSAARRQRRLHGYIAQLNAGQDLIGSIVASVESATRTLQEAEARRNEAPVSSEDMNFVRFELQRYDEKIVNLTKAMRSFGGPVMEITKQLGDTAHLLNEQKRGLDELMAANVARQTSLEQALHEEIARLEELTRGSTDRLAGEIKATHSALDARLTKSDGDLESRLQSAITALEGQIGTHGRHARECLEAMAARTEQQVAHLQKAMGGAAANVDLAAVEQALGAVEKELRSLTGVMHRQTTASVDRTATPNPPVVAERPTPSAPDAMPASGVAQSIAGTRAAPAGNVLGAIARLKKMRG